MKIKTKILLGIVVFVVVYGALQILPYHKDKKDTPFRIKGNEAPLVIAHGGAKKLNPENTILAFDNVYAMGVDVLETDLCMTKDGILITHHNETIDATSNEKGKVFDYDYEDLIKFNFGYRFKALDGSYPYREVQDEETKRKLVPMRVDEMFEKYGDNVSYIMEIKDDGALGKKAAKELNELIVRYGLEKNVCVASFDQEVLDYFLKIRHPDIITSLDYDSATSFVVANLIGYGIFMDYEGYGMHLPMKERNIPLSDKYLIWKIHKNDMFVHYWTIDDKEDMKMLITNGADGIITDRPDLLFEVFEEMGYKN